LKYAAVFVLSAGLLGAGGFFGNQYYQKQIQQETIAVQTKVQKQVEQKYKKQRSLFPIRFLLLLLPFLKEKCLITLWLALFYKRKMPQKCMTN